MHKFPIIIGLTTALVSGIGIMLYFGADSRLMIVPFLLGYVVCEALILFREAQKKKERVQAAPSMVNSYESNVNTVQMVRIMVFLCISAGIALLMS